MVQINDHNATRANMVHTHESLFEKIGIDVLVICLRPSIVDSQCWKYELVNKQFSVASRIIRNDLIIAHGNIHVRERIPHLIKLAFNENLLSNVDSIELIWKLYYNNRQLKVTLKPNLLRYHFEDKHTSFKIAIGVIEICEKCNNNGELKCTLTEKSFDDQWCLCEKRYTFQCTVPTFKSQNTCECGNYFTCIRALFASVGCMIGYVLELMGTRGTLVGATIKAPVDISRNGKTKTTRDINLYEGIDKVVDLKTASAYANGIIQTTRSLCKKTGYINTL
jgi:hypothetical protein